MILQLDHDYQKIAHAIAFVDMYINAPESVDCVNVYTSLRTNPTLSVSEAVAVLMEMVEQKAEEGVKRIVIQEMRRPEFRRYIRAVLNSSQQ